MLSPQQPLRRLPGGAPPGGLTSTSTSRTRGAGAHIGCKPRRRAAISTLPPIRRREQPILARGPLRGVGFLAGLPKAAKRSATPCFSPPVPTRRTEAETGHSVSRAAVDRVVRPPVSSPGCPLGTTPTACTSGPRARALVPLSVQQHQQLAGCSRPTGAPAAGQQIRPTIYAERGPGKTMWH
jgi:hypothetical protein